MFCSLGLEAYRGLRARTSSGARIEGVGFRVL